MKREAVVPAKEFKTKAEKCAFEIINFLIRHEMWQDTNIYVNGKRYSCYDGEHYQYDNTWDCVFREDDMNPRDYVEYASDFLTMTFEGPFYDSMISLTTTFLRSIATRFSVSSMTF